MSGRKYLTNEDLCLPQINVNELAPSIDLEVAFTSHVGYNYLMEGC